MPYQDAEQGEKESFYSESLTRIVTVVYAQALGARLIHPMRTWVSRGVHQSMEGRGLSWGPGGAWPGGFAWQWRECGMIRRVIRRVRGVFGGGIIHIGKS